MQAGSEQFPSNAFLQIVAANFSLGVKGDPMAGHSALRRAKGMKLTVPEKFYLFVREQEAKQSKQSESSGEAAVDMVSYVEFQNNFR